jgi:hypothetical protein
MSRMQSVKRKYFNESQGASALEIKATKASLKGLRIDSSHYLGLAAVSCVLKYMEYVQGRIYAPASLSVCTSFFISID